MFLPHTSVDKHATDQNVIDIERDAVRVGDEIEKGTVGVKENYEEELFTFLNKTKRRKMVSTAGTAAKS
jgi:hypothetical protein